ncbi:uncharacterized protein LOC106071301 isoform X3 [Biomphalaria glabrata]|uniref:Uncharacterized protein LOC106071301 isoform X3 n=1 Tax=Biomphalaria glabrata TaxID=6526 RepID=A0A9W3BFL5_BIOGL|nr:uncharacterized protein LOC106071301 isoform X3 [Biomphalaria glabrata]
MTIEEIWKTFCFGLLLTSVLINAWSDEVINSKRNVETDMCPTPPAPRNGAVHCEYSDALQIQIFCTITCNSGYIFNTKFHNVTDYVFPCDVATGFYDTVSTPGCIHL